MRSSRASNARRSIFGLGIAAGLFLAALPAGAQPERAGEDVATVHDRCIDLVRRNPKEGLERARVWKSEGGGFAADHCIGMALFMLKDYAAAAERFETLASAMMAAPPEQRAQALDQAGQSWLDANDPARAKLDFDGALALNGKEVDLLIDRSEAFAAMKKYWEAIDDLNNALDLQPDRADALIYRGTAYRYLDSLDLALEDIDHALKLAPNSPAALLERGNIHRLKGDIADARADWTHVRELAPNTAEGKAAETNLDRLGGTAAVAKKKPGS